MAGIRRPVFILLCVLAVCAQASLAADATKDQLDKAKAARADERAKAKSALIAAIDGQVKTAGAAGDLDTLKSLTSQKDAFSTAGVMPNLPSLKDAVSTYTQSMRKADGALVTAYEAAIEDYTTQNKTDDAMAIRKERHALLEGTADLPTPDSPDAVSLLLDRAKADYTQTINDAKKTYLQAIDARLKVSTDAGDLNTVTKLQAARTAAEADLPFADGFNDAAVMNAKSRYGITIQTSNQKLAGAYRDAIRNFTRTRAIDRAQSTQAEFDATGLNAAPQTSTISPGSGPLPEGPTKLTRALPYFLGASGGFAAEKDGVRPAKGTMVATKSADFLSKDFVFDVGVNVPKDEEWVVVGVGDATEKGSVRLIIRIDGGWGRRAFLTHGDQWGEHIGDIHSGEAYIVRLERHGGPITASVGTITDGKFTADVTQTVSDIKAFAPDVSDKRAHLFFGGQVVFTQVRLAVGAAATAGASGGGETRSPNSPIKFPVAGAGGAGAPIITAPAKTADDSDATKGIYKLNTDKLPAPFSATGTFSVTSAGLKPLNDKTLIITKDQDYLSKDFIFEASLDLPAKYDHDSMEIGLGDGTDKGSIRMIVRVEGGFPPRAYLAQGDRWGKNFGDVRDGGPHVMRVERHGTAVTVSIGTEQNGKFEADHSQTVSDPKASVSELSDRRARLFFTGKAMWTKIRLVTGDAASGPAASAPGGSEPVKGSRKK